jgi:glucan phosphoethanolaminetransferase (alkaline phosphatase superfamily)
MREIVNKGLTKINSVQAAEGKALAKFRINIFYVISSICCLLLIVYAWMVFLPVFRDTPGYPSVQTMVIWLTVLLIAIAAVQLYLSISKEPKEKVEEI